MCWQSKKTPIKRTAEEDIKVKKILFLNNEYILLSPIRRKFMWDKNTLYTTELGEVERDVVYKEFTISSGFHTAISIIDKESYWYSCCKNRNHPLFTKEYGESVFDAIIPKGSEYYLNEYGECVSNQLIIL